MAFEKAYKPREQILKDIATELDRAYAKHGAPQWSRHEFYGILLEEVEETWDTIKADEPMERLYEEAISVAAMVIRFFETGERYGFGEVKPHREVYRYTMPPYGIAPAYYYGSVKRSCACGDDLCSRLPKEEIGF